LRPTNPLTREPQVMASFLASIDSLTNGRAFMDIASGDSAVLNIGYKIASRARIAEYITCVRDLLATGEATYRRRPQRVRWSGAAVRNRVPISICAEGPKMLELAGRIGDGVIAGTGLLPEVIADTVARVHAERKLRAAIPPPSIYGLRRERRSMRIVIGDRQRQGVGVFYSQSFDALQPRE